jgi:hypothetical protein
MRFWMGPERRRWSSEMSRGSKETRLRRSKMAKAVRMSP